MSNWRRAYKFQSPELQLRLEEAFHDDVEINRMSNAFKGQKNFSTVVEPLRVRDSNDTNGNAGGAPNGIVRVRKPFDFAPQVGELGEDATDNQKYVAFDCGTSFVHFKHGAGELSLSTPGAEVYLQNCAAGNDPAYDGTTTGLRIANSSTMGTAMVVDGQGVGVTDLNWNNADPATTVPENPSSNSIQGKRFIVNGVEYESVPADDAAAIAQTLRDSANTAGQQEFIQNKNSWDSSEKGRIWVGKNVYLPMIKKNPDKYKDPEASAKYYANKLGTDGESYWSSWFMRRCHINYWDVDPAKRTPGLDSSYIYDYTANEGLAQRIKVEANPDSFKSQIVFITFRTTEAPLFVGDCVWNARGKGKPNNFEVLTPTGRQANSHMKIITKKDGTTAKAVGGNEGNYGTVNEETLTLDSEGRIIKPTRMKAVYKRVRVVGKAEGSESVT